MSSILNSTVCSRTYLAPCLWRSAQIPFWGTSDTLGTLSEMPKPALKRFKIGECNNI